jgi:hypothetical protein
MTKKQVQSFEAAYQAAMTQWGEHNMITQRAEMVMVEARAQYTLEAPKRERSKALRQARHQAYTECGMVRVKGALGGTYYE